eukprot:scaffold603_cov118-Cylindrotheca_fusiformis.AAC.3
MWSPKLTTLFSIVLVSHLGIEKCAALQSVLPKQLGFSIKPNGCTLNRHSAMNINGRKCTLESGRRLMAKSPKEADDKDADSWKWLATLVIPLQLVYVSNQWSRSSIYYLVNFSPDADSFRAMNVAVGFSEAQYGLLASLAFTALFAVASLGAGVAADRYNRKTLTIVAAVGWSVATLGTSLSSTYPEVLGWRIAMGLACAFATPTAYTLINERVPDDRVSFATSLYGTGVAFGGALASLSILLDNEFGWQQALTIISLAGFGSAGLSAVLLPDDNKEEKPADLMEVEDKEEGKSDFFDDVLEILESPRARWLYLATFLRFCSGLCIGVWSASYFKEAFPENASDYAVAQAVITGVAGSVSGLLGGYAADRLASSGEGDDGARKLLVPIVASALAAPAWYLAVHSTDSFQTAMTWLSIEYLIAESWFGPTISSLLGSVKKGGTAQGMFTLTGAVANLAPTLLGVLYSSTAGDESSAGLLNLLSTSVCLCYVLSSACFVISARSPSSTTETTV